MIPKVCLHVWFSAVWCMISFMNFTNILNFVLIYVLWGLTAKICVGCDIGWSYLQLLYGGLFTSVLVVVNAQTNLSIDWIVSFVTGRILRYFIIKTNHISKDSFHPKSNFSNRILKYCVAQNNCLRLLKFRYRIYDLVRPTGFYFVAGFVLILVSTISVICGIIAIAYVLKRCEIVLSSNLSKCRFAAVAIIMLA